MRWGFFLPVFALLSGCAGEAALTGTTPDLSLASAPADPALPAATAAAAPGAGPGTAAPAASAPSPLATPVKLSRTQTAAIEDALWRAVDDPAWVKVGSVNAGIGRDGVTVVCGTLKSRNSFGVYSKPTPFRGEFRGKEFKTAALGGQNAAATLATCEKAGLPINPQEG